MITLEATLSEINLYNFNPQDAREADFAANILINQLIEDGLAKDVYIEAIEGHDLVWTDVAKRIKAIAIETRLTTPMGYAWAWADGRLGGVLEGKFVRRQGV